MRPNRHLLIAFSIVLIAALLAACAAPAAATPLPPPPAPLPPTPLPAPTEAPPPDPIAVVRAWADAICSGDVDAALSYFTDNGNRIADCEWVNTGVKCELSVSDGCMEAYGAAGGLPGTMTFYEVDRGMTP